MRTFERELVVLVVLAAALLLRRPRVWTGWVFCVAALAALAAQVWIEGAHWQMGPVYLGLMLAGWQLTREDGARRRVGWAVALAVLAGMSIALAWVLPMFQLPTPTGQYSVGTRTLDLVDASRGADGLAGDGGRRELVVQMWYPAEAGGRRARYVRAAEVKPRLRYESEIRTNSWQDAPLARAGGALPVILFGPGWAGRRTLDTFLLEDLASHGYVVAAVDHPGNAAQVELRDGRVLRGTEEGALSTGPGSSVAGVEQIWAKELGIWTADNEFVLDRLAAATAEWAGGRLDLTRVCSLGHSFGGAASLRLLGLAVPAGAVRVRCGVNLDGWTFGGLADRTGAEPVMILYEASGEATPVGESVDARLSRMDQAIVAASVERYGGTIAYVSGTQHLDFTDQTLVSPLQSMTYTGPIRGERMRTITRAMVLGFFDQVLKGTADPVVGMPEVKRVVWPGR